MVVLAMRDPGGGVHERHRLVVVLELVGLGDGLAIARPALQPLQHRAHLLVGERRDAALAGNALLARELVHGALRRWAIRRAAGGCRIIHQRMQRIGRERGGVVAVELGERAHEVRRRGVLRGIRIGLEFLLARDEARSERLERET